MRPSFIRAFNASDLDAVANVYNQSKLDELKYEECPFTLLPLFEDPKRYPALMECDIYVYDDGGVQGFLGIFENEIRALFVLPESRGKAIGSQLLNYALALKADIGVLALYIASSNLPARTLYEKFGFTSDQTFTTEYNGQSVQADRMIRQA